MFEALFPAEFLAGFYTCFYQGVRLASDVIYPTYYRHLSAIRNSGQGSWSPLYEQPGRLPHQRDCPGLQLTAGHLQWLGLSLLHYTLPREI